MKTYLITPMGKPRMTRQDKFKKRKPVMMYRAFKDECNLRRVKLPQSGYHVAFVLPMPRSWSEKKKTEMNGQPHTQKPDKDNLEKALLDALYDDDAAIWDGRVSKFWGREGAIIVKEIEPPTTLQEFINVI